MQDPSRNSQRGPWAATILSFASSSSALPRPNAKGTEHALPPGGRAEWPFETPHTWQLSSATSHPLPSLQLLLSLPLSSLCFPTAECIFPAGPPQREISPESQENI